ncbi:hypothetical protein BT93_F2277 [Corymbia citriodora subsp. variegata]|nr:hypothetical protein BT93_F2277 [Corymbia citriodora subsp. variegata]
MSHVLLLLVTIPLVSSSTIFYYFSLSSQAISSLFMLEIVYTMYICEDRKEGLIHDS